MLYTGKLKKGANILLIAPSSPLRLPATAEDCANGLNALGYNTVMGNSLKANTEKGYAASPELVRADDINRGFNDPNIDAIWAVRGGSMAMELLPLIDYEAIRKHPKPLFGFSDVTALHIAIQERCGIVSFHAPCASHLCVGRANAYAVEALDRMLNLTHDTEFINPNAETLNIIRPGTAAGELVGGNLTLTASLTGTDYALNTSGKILFLEDIDEDVYRLNRMLLQLKYAHMFERAEGIVFGAFSNCKNGYNPNYGPEKLLCDFFADYEKPVYSNISVGHIPQNGTLPLGMQCEMKDGTLTFRLN